MYQMLLFIQLKYASSNSEVEIWSENLAVIFAALRFGSVSWLHFYEELKQDEERVKWGVTFSIVSASLFLVDF